MTALHSLGLGTLAPVAGLSQAPPPAAHIPRSIRRQPLLKRANTPPTQHPDAGHRQRVGSLIGGFASTLMQLDYLTRQLQNLGVFRYETKAKVNIMASHAEALLLEAQKSFDCQDADAVNALSNVLGQAAELLLQLTPAQIEASMQHMNEMAKANLAYVPAPTPYTATLT